MYNCSLQAEESLRCQDFSIDQLAQNFRLASGVEEVVKGTLVKICRIYLEFVHPLFLHACFWRQVQILARYGRLLTGEPGNVRPSPLQLLRSVRPSVEVSPFEGFELQLDDKGNLLGTEIEGFQLVTGSSPSTGVGLRKVIKQVIIPRSMLHLISFEFPSGYKTEIRWRSRIFFG